MNQRPLTPFPCTSCGLCCRNISVSTQTQFLDRGDGVCRHLCETSNLCQIYEERPLVCRVEAYYRQNLSHQLAWEEYVEMNVAVCRELQNKA